MNGDGLCLFQSITIHHSPFTIHYNYKLPNENFEPGICNKSCKQNLYHNGKKV